MTERTISAEERRLADKFSVEELARAALAEHDRAERLAAWNRHVEAKAARLSAWVSGDVARARELAQSIEHHSFDVMSDAEADLRHVKELAAEIVALLTPPESE